MGHWLGVLGIVALTSCGRLDFVPSDDASTDGATSDGADGADTIGTGSWSTPTVVSGISLAGVSDEDCTLRGDMLELYFTSSRTGMEHLYVAQRTDVSSAWSTPAQVANLNAAGEYDATPEITYDGLAMWFSSTRQPAAGTDFFATTRASLATLWSSPAFDPQLSVVSTFEYGAQPNATQLTLVFGSDRSGNYDLYVSTRSSTAVPWGAPVAITELNTAMQEKDPFLTDDGLTLYFTSDAGGNDEIVYATRVSQASSFGAPQPVTELSSPGSDQDVWLSADLRHAFFASDRSGDFEIYEVSR